MDLEELIEKYISERVEFQRISVGKAARLHGELIGPAGFDSSGIGFVRFLKASGVKEPTTAHLDRRWVGDYQYYLEQFHGTIRLKSAFIALRSFWRWCADNGFFSSTVDPPRLAGVTIIPHYRVSMKLHRRSS